MSTIIFTILIIAIVITMAGLGAWIAVVALNDTMPRKTGKAIKFKPKKGKKVKR